MIDAGVTNQSMTVPELEKLIADLNRWCEKGRGRQAKIAAALSISRGLVHDWLKRRRVPSVDQFFALKEFLKKQRDK